MPCAFGTVEELGEGNGFRKVRKALGVSAFGVNVIVMPPDFDGFLHYHDIHDAQERVEVFLVGAGVRVQKKFEPGRLDRPPKIRIRPTKAGVIRYWAVLQPYGTRSRIIGVRVR